MSAIKRLTVLCGLQDCHKDVKIEGDMQNTLNAVGVTDDYFSFLLCFLVFPKDYNQKNFLCTPRAKQWRDCVTNLSGFSTLPGPLDRSKGALGPSPWGQ